MLAFVDTEPFTKLTHDVEHDLYFFETSLDHCFVWSQKDLVTLLDEPHRLNLHTKTKEETIALVNQLTGILGSPLKLEDELVSTSEENGQVQVNPQVPNQLPPLASSPPATAQVAPIAEEFNKIFGQFLANKSFNHSQFMDCYFFTARYMQQVYIHFDKLK